MKEKSFNANTVLLAILCGLGSWQLHETYVVHGEVSALNQEIISIRADVTRHEQDIRSLQHYTKPVLGAASAANP